MSTLTKLKLANASRKPVEETPEERMRNRMVAHLTDQLEMATALAEGRPYKATRTVREKGEDGATVTVEREKRLRPWYWHDLSGKWFIELRYANTVLALGKVGNLNLLERPLRIEAFLNAVALALRARRRQYQTRTHMRQLEEVKEGLAQATLEAVRANEAKSRFLAAASHDLRQPFQAMRLYHQIVTDALDGAPAHMAAVRLGDAITSGEDLLNALLDLSTLEAGVTKVVVSDFEIGQVLDSVGNDLGAVADKKGLTLRVRPAPRVMVRSDPVLLKRIIRNLAMNAVRYTERGKVLIGCRPRSDHVQVQVWDTGIGIAADKVNRIFEDFFQINNVERDRSKGMGLGLSIVERMARLLNHQISVRSKPGRGSVFTVTVARSSAP